MTVVVRNANAGDKSRCLELLKLLNEDNIGIGIAATFDELITETRGAIFVAEEANQLLGMASVSYNIAMRYEGEYCQLEELIVDPEARGKSIGRLLLEHMLGAAKARGCAEVGLYLIASTEHNRVFYEKLGFSAVGSEMRQKL